MVKRPSVRPHLEGETPTNESSGGETSTCMGRIIQEANRPGPNRPGGETSRRRNFQAGGDAASGAKCP